tara:strand:- start:11306 stop:11848 length:543 start_codon:yes stop_codon:yes gene_type:complete
MDDIILSIDTKTEKPIVLIGMMGCGKSFVGQRLALALGIPFYDTDVFIEKDQGKKIVKIFADQGEEYFRTLETQAISTLLKKGRCVIATGGGLVTTSENLALIKNHAFSIWLQSDIQMIIKRLDGDDTRPLLQSGDPEKTLEHLLNTRKALYSNADIHIDNKGDIETILQTIKARIGHIE